jgi:uncharacterized damage-inducible protein DinB
MKATKADIDKILVALADTPGRIAEAAEELSDAQLHLKANRGAWSASDVLAHLRSCNDLWTYSIYAMLAEKEPVLPDINERKWAKVTRYAELPFAESLQVFTLQRSSLLKVLRELSFEDWERSALIFERRHTVFTQARRMAKHEVEHCSQIESLLESVPVKR